jgi:hypothetical protein
MKTAKTKTILTLSVSILLGLAAATRVSAFKIDFLTTFVPLPGSERKHLEVYE